MPGIAIWGFVAGLTGVVLSCQFRPATLASQGACTQGVVPDRTCTIGQRNPDVTPETMATTICLPGWASSIRPPTSQLRSVREATRQAYQIPDGPEYVLDHLIPISLGGHPNALANLWPQPGTGPWNSRVKDRLEGVLKRAVCGGTLDLMEGQRLIARDWVAAYQMWVGIEPLDNDDEDEDGEEDIHYECAPTRA